MGAASPVYTPGLNRWRVSSGCESRQLFPGSSLYRTSGGCFGAWRPRHRGETSKIVQWKIAGYGARWFVPASGADQNHSLLSSSCQVSLQGEPLMGRPSGKDLRFLKCNLYSENRFLYTIDCNLLLFF
ncbi:UNVERIFIED_CONTAM: hypothetical protein K2H54_055299 [Gekko kuhli]